MDLIVARPCSLADLPGVMYLVVASEVEQLVSEELYTCWIWIGLEHGP